MHNLHWAMLQGKKPIQSPQAQLQLVQACLSMPMPWELKPGPGQEQGHDAGFTGVLTLSSVTTTNN